jgi:hypothetical protein
LIAFEVRLLDQSVETYAFFFRLVHADVEARLQQPGRRFRFGDLSLASTSLKGLAIRFCRPNGGGGNHVSEGDTPSI